MKNKKIIVNIAIILILCICIVCTVLYINNFKKLQKNQVLMMRNLPSWLTFMNLKI